MNWGGFAGGFAQGFGSGINMVTKFDELAKKGQIEKMRAQGIAEAQAAYNADVESRIQDNSQAQNQAVSGGITGKPAEQVTAPSGQPTESLVQNPEKATGATVTPVAAPTKFSSVEPKPQDEDRSITIQRAKTEPSRAIADAPAPGTATATPTSFQAGLPFVVNGKGYATREEARAAAKKSGPDMLHFMYTTAFPKEIEARIAVGDVDGAEKLQALVDSKQGKIANKLFADGYNAIAFSGDVNGGIKKLGEFYNKYVNDGVEWLGGEEGQDGKINIRLKQKGSDTESTMQITRGQLMRMALAYNPAELVKQNLVDFREAESAAAKSAAELKKREADLQADLYREQYQQKGRLQLKGVENQYQTQRDARQQENAIELKTIESQLQDAGASQRVQREVGAKVQVLRGASYSDEFINGVLPELLGVGNYKKAMPPEDAKLKIRGELMANDRDFQKMTEAQRQAQVNEVMKFIYSGTSNGTTPGKTGSTSTPQGGLPVWRP